MSKIVLKGGVYLNTKHGMDRWEVEHNFFVGEPESFSNYILITPYDIAVDVPAGFDPRPVQVAALEARRKELQEKFAAAVMEIDQRINSLLALEAA